MSSKHLTFPLAFICALLISACAPSEPEVLRLATTTSTYDSGLLNAILPEFEQAHNARVDVVAVGTGQAIALGQNGDADVILVHARAREDQFVSDGYGTERSDVMYNDFVVVGPADDPAGISDLTSAAAAFAAILGAEAPFASRGDDSGTHTKERSIWEAAGIEPTAESGWYNSLGQGMGETLNFANEQAAYTLTDRGTFLAQRDHLSNLEIVFGGQSIDENPDARLYNPYGVIPVNPELHGGTNLELAQQFVEWLTSLETQNSIAGYGLDQFGQPLFYPDSATYRAANP